MKNKLKTKDLVYIGISVALITICSWISIPLAIPITLQTLAICLIAGLFGAKTATLSTVIYIVLASLGLPVLAQFTGGIGIVFGSTGGYIIGFIFTGLIIGIVSDKTDGKLWKLIVSMVIGILVCYIFGTIWFAAVYAKSSEPASIGTILGWCVVPFIIPDAVKIVLAGILTNRLKRYIK